MLCSTCNLGTVGEVLGGVETDGEENGGSNRALASAKWGRGAAPILSNASSFEALAGLVPELLRIDDPVFWVSVLH